MGRAPLRSLLLLVLLSTLLSSCAGVRERPVEDGRQTGLASWYGKDFHGKPTASGEIYNMYAMTAAHKTLPLGTVVEVRNLDNGRSAKVVINDRGPFVAGRIIDLSYAAAKKLGMADAGVADVELKVLGRKERYVKEVRYQDGGGGGGKFFVVQVGAFVERDNAERLKTALGWKHDGVYITRKTVSGRLFYRVRAGRFADRDKARSLAGALAEEGYDVVIMRD